ncbi:MAG: GDP-mannose 4,6-dehydratase, partial [Victivallales bacterium]|nr:GDP-mannose 4,6-dehydratase [Victivallales bacterium]
ELGIKLIWKGEGVDKKAYNADTGECIVEVDPMYFRPAEVETLLGDPSKAKEKLGWVPRTTLKELVAEMVREDLKIAERDELCLNKGFQVNQHSD